MRYNTSIVFFLIISILTSCATDDSVSSCSDTALCVPIESLFISFISQNTGEDLFVNGSFDFNQLSVTDTDTGEDVSFELSNFIDINENGVIDENEIGSNSELLVQIDFGLERRDFSYQILLSENVSVPLNFSTILEQENEFFINPAFGDNDFERLGLVGFRVFLN